MRGGEFVDFYLGNTTEDGQERYASIRGQPDFFTVPEDWAKLLIELATQPPYTETVREPPNSG